MTNNWSDNLPASFGANDPFVYAIVRQAGSPAGNSLEHAEILKIGETDDHVTRFGRYQVGGQAHLGGGPVRLYYWNLKNYPQATTVDGNAREWNWEAPLAKYFYDRYAQHIQNHQRQATNIPMEWDRQQLGMNINADLGARSV